MALADRDTIMDFIAKDNPTAAIELDNDFEAKAEQARLQPTLYRTSRRMKGARELVVRPNYVMVYRIEDEGATVAILRVLHAAQKWP